MSMTLGKAAEASIEGVLVAICATEGCEKPRFTKSGLCRSCNMKSSRAKRGNPSITPKASKSAVPIAVKDEMDVKLDHFKYTKSEHDLDIWEHNEEISPLHVPNDIKKNYSDLRFHWVAKAKIDRNGQGYQGWQLFKDAKHPEGVHRGNDLILAAMPEERAKRYNQSVIDKSEGYIRGVADQDMQSRDALASAQLKRMGHEVSSFGSGISIDSSARGKRPIRGLHPEEVVERNRKMQEQRGKRKVYFT